MVAAPDQVDLHPLQDAVAVLRSTLKGLEPSHLSSAEAKELVELFAEVERLGAAGRTLAARVVERSGAWRRDGHRSAAHWMAAATGVSVGQAVGALQTARRLESLPATTEAFASGELSETQVREVAAAASPGAETELLAAARAESVSALRERCRGLRAATDQDEAYERIRRSRYLRHWTDPEGAVRLDARLTPDDGARVLAGLEPHRRRITAEARAAGRREPPEAHAADALVAATGGGAAPEGRGPCATVHVRVDRSALVRGHTVRGEVCEIPGVGPIPVGAARRLASDAILKAFLTDGADVTAVAHLGRTVPARLRTALETRDPACVVPGCGVRTALEIDHRVPFAEGGPTTLDNLARLCGWHHYLKSHHGYRLGGGPGAWTWAGPDPPLDARRGPPVETGHPRQGPTTLVGTGDPSRYALACIENSSA